MSASSSPVGFAIIGSGNIAEFHAKAISLTPEARLQGIFGRTESKAKALADAFGAKTYRSFHDLAADDSIEAVCVTTPSGAHAEAVIPLLEAGKHVLVEKPAEITSEAIVKMIETAKRSRRLLAGVFQARMAPGARILRQAIEAGRFGRITLCSAYIKWWRSQEYYDSGGWRGTWKLDGGGALMNQGIHAVDLLQWMAGMPVEIQARTAMLAHERIEVEDTAVATLRFANGALGVVEAATSAWPGFSRRVEISGTAGSAIFEDERIRFWQFDEDLPGDAEIRAQASAPSSASGASDPKAIPVDGHRMHVADLTRAIREGGTPAVSGNELLHAVRIIEAIYESGKSGALVCL